MYSDETSGTVTIQTNVEIAPIKELASEMEKAALSAEKLADALERIRSVFKN